MNNNQKQNRKTKMKYPQTKTEVKRDLLAITKKLQYLQLTQFCLLCIAIIYWIAMVIIANKPLACTDTHHNIAETLARKKNVTDKRLMFHPSVDYQHAIDLENYYECYMIRQGCPRYLVEKNLTIDGVSIECTDKSQNPNVTTITEEMCQTICVPEPYTIVENIDHIGDDLYKPIALEWYAILHFWDMLVIIIALFIQIRLKNVKKTEFHGPMILDEKDIATASMHILTVFITLSFYAVDLVMTCVWVSLHSNGSSFDKDHGSYWTVYERNYKLKVLHCIYVVMLMPILVVAILIKSQFQQYELRQFMTEIQ